MSTMDLILFLLAIIAIIIIIYYIYKGLSTFGSWLGGSLEDLIKKIEAPFESASKSISDFVSNISKSYWQFKEETEKSLTNVTQQNLICLISGTCTVADVLKEQEQNQKVIIPPVYRYYYTTG